MIFALACQPWWPLAVSTYSDISLLTDQTAQSTTCARCVPHDACMRATRPCGVCATWFVWHTRYTALVHAAFNFVASLVCIATPKGANPRFSSSEFGIRP